ncbi:MAG: hypothetical protein CMP00_03755 [Woeseiaceae bacterium]|jgi:hypothetical protein|nr:hypothetical protein [Woeseiaceae bacterium]MDG1015961.1 hypothetical protein [Woeseiaceae bacterium]|tara:strand:- start:5261 stop:5647 length:387 start_codon:yes stop_codon:yes gene_type:complete
MHYLNTLSGLIIGIILFHTGFITRTVFNHLDEESTKIFLRAIFPKFFLLLAFIGFSFILVGGYLNPGLNKTFAVGVVNAILPSICYFLIPVTNSAKDNNETKKFKLLHFISVMLTVITLLANILFVFS